MLAHQLVFEWQHIRSQPLKEWLLLVPAGPKLSLSASITLGSAAHGREQRADGQVGGVRLGREQAPHARQQRRQRVVVAGLQRALHAGQHALQRVRRPRSLRGRRPADTCPGSVAGTAQTQLGCRTHLSMSSNGAMMHATRHVTSNPWCEGASDGKLYSLCRPVCGEQTLPTFLRSVMRRE